jgi:uncharacterized protein YggE
MKSIYIYAVIIAVGVSVALAFMQQGVTNEAKAQYNNSNINAREVTVTGFASRVIKPDKVVLTLTVENEDAKISDAIKNNATSVSKVIEVLKSLGINDEQITTSQYSVNPVYSLEQVGDIECSHYTPPRKECLVGYRATYVLTITMDSDANIGKVVDAVSEAGVTSITGIGFTLSEELHKSVMDELIKDAVEDAKSKAEKLLMPLGESIGKVKSIRYYPGYYYPYFSAPQFAPLYAGLATPIYVETKQIDVSVEVTFLIEGQ